MAKVVISDEARAERNAYLRAWRAKNRDKVRAANSAYWERKAANKNSLTTDSIGKEAGDNERTNWPYDGLFEAAYQSGYPKSYIANNYQKFGFTSSSGAYDGYKDWLEGQNGGGDGNPAPSGDLSKLGYDPDEGIFTWGGNRYNDLQMLIDAMGSVPLTSAEKEAIKRKMDNAGFKIEF